MSIRSFCSITLLSALCLFSAFGAVCPARAAEAQSPLKAQQQPEPQKPPKAQPPAAPRQNVSQPAAAARSTPKAASPITAANKSAAKRSLEDPTRLKEDLDVFAKDCIVRMNRQRRPGITAKEVKRQPDGTYMARYMAVDPDSLQTSYDPTAGNKTIKYIGRMDYHEVEYVCVGKDQKQALAGPFNEANRVPVTELIKYKKGKWSY